MIPEGRILLSEASQISSSSSPSNPSSMATQDIGLQICVGKVNEKREEIKEKGVLKSLYRAIIVHYIYIYIYIYRTATAWQPPSSPRKKASPEETNV